jgi:hypothetical protein
MKAVRIIGAALGGLSLLAGCTTLRDVPRSDYTAQAERKNVRIWTQEGLEYEFDFVRVENDSLIGYRHQDVEGSFDDYAILAMPLSEVQRLSARKVDWKRTSLVGGGVLAAVVVAGLSGDDPPPATQGSGGTGFPRIP